jgi:hypothetical protein
MARLKPCPDIRGVHFVILPEGKARAQRGLADGRAESKTNPAKELN